MKKKVVVLLSSYNGWDYIEDQLKSIYEQSYKEIEVLIRDDGSEKSFVEYLKMLQKSYPFILYEGCNKGFLESFMWLLKKAEDYEYYSFADQDDIWLKDKTLRAVQWLERQDKDIPLLYHSAYDIVDVHMKKKGTFLFSEENYDFRRSLTENHYSGFSMVINRKMRELMLKGDVSKIGYHDWWAAMIGKAFGKTYFDTEVAALHRSHDSNVTKMNLVTRFRWLADSIKNESEMHRRIIEFARLFYDELSEKDKKILVLFIDDNYSLRHALKKMFYPRRWRPIVSSEIVVRFLMLLGKI